MVRGFKLSKDPTNLGSQQEMSTATENREKYHTERRTSAPIQGV